MNQPLLVGGKITRLRQRAKLSQVALAERLGVSPSYLNLIERDRRPLTQPLLDKLTQTLRIESREILGRDDARLHAELMNIFADPMFHGSGPGAEVLTQIIDAAPEAARAIPRLYRAYRQASEDAQGLGNDLAASPFLEETNYRFLTQLTSIRSFAEILRDNADLAVDRRQQYIGTVATESERLTDLVNELFAFLADPGAASGPEAGNADGGRQGASPALEVSAFVQMSGSYFPELEAAAARIGSDLRAQAVDRETPPSESAFESAAGRELDLLTARAGVSSGARALLRQYLGGYLAGAVLMPYDAFRATAQDLRHDIELLAGRFGVSFEQVARRLATLQRPGAEGIPFHFLRADIAGNVTERFTASGLRLPRIGGACPRWNLYSAFLNSGQVQVQVARLPDDQDFLFLARAETKPGAGYHAPPQHFSVSLGCDLSFAEALIYADGLDLGDDRIATPVGTHCRQCPREDCSDRTTSFVRR